MDDDLPKWVIILLEELRTVREPSKTGLLQKAKTNAKNPDVD